MMRRSRFRACRWVVGLCVLAMFLASCESRDEYVGTYQAEAKGFASKAPIILELRGNGNGVWKVASDKGDGTFDEVQFGWYIKGGDLRINTKAGGVIVGKIDKDTIRMTLPGPRKLTFKKVQ